MSGKRYRPLGTTRDDLKASERTRRAAWLGLFGTADKLVSARTEVEREFAQGRILHYVSKLRGMGVTPTPEDETP